MKITKKDIRVLRRLLRNAVGWRGHLPPESWPEYDAKMDQAADVIMKLDLQRRIRKEKLQ